MTKSSRFRLAMVVAVLAAAGIGGTRTARFLAIYDIIGRVEAADESLAYQPLFGRHEHNVHIRAFCRDDQQHFQKLYSTARTVNLSVLRE